jgi:hypothetical protein
MIFPKRRQGNAREYSFGRISWNLPWHTLTKRYFFFVNLSKTSLAEKEIASTIYDGT